MRIVILLPVFLVFSLYRAIAQEPVAVVGQTHEQNDPAVKFVRILSTDASGVYMLKESGTTITDREFYIDKFDPSFNPVYSKRLNMSKGVMGDVIDVHSVHVIKGNIIVLKEGFKKAITKGFINSYRVNADGEVSDVLKELDSFTADKLAQTANYSVSISPDQSKIVLLAQYPSAKDVNERIRLKVFDADFTELWTKEITYSHPSKGAYANDVRVNNSGEVFILKKMIGEQYHTFYKLYVCSTKGTLWKEHVVNTGANFISEQAFIVSRGGQAIVAGLYSTEMKWQDHQYGTFFFSVNGNGEVTAQKTEAFPDVLYKDISNRVFKKISGEPYVIGFKVKNLLERNDGSIEMITEFFKHSTETITSTTPGALPVVQNQDTYGQILIYAFSPVGTTLWMSKINKEQFSKIDNGAFSSFMYAMINDRLLIFYNQVEVLYYTDKAGLRHEYPGCTADTYYKTSFIIVQADGTISDEIPAANMYNRVAFKMSLNPNVYYLNEKNELIFMIEMLHHKRFALGSYKL